MYPVHLKRLFSACIPPLVVTLIYTEQVVAPAYTSLLFAHATTTYTKNAFPPLFAGKLQRLAQASLPGSSHQHTFPSLDMPLLCVPIAILSIMFTSLLDSQSHKDRLPHLSFYSHIVGTC